MSCSVNLVPVNQLLGRRRARRQVAWGGSALVLLGLLALAGGVQRVAGSAVVQLRQEVAALEAQRAELQRRLSTADGRRQQLMTRLQTLAQARCGQPWARWLVDLTRSAPPGVFLTAISAAPPVVEAVAGARAASENQPRPQGASSAAPAARPTPGLETQSVRLLGYAVSHEALLQFLNALQRLPGWQRVDLIRAAQEPLGGALAVGFELEARVTATARQTDVARTSGPDALRAADSVRTEGAAAGKTDTTSAAGDRS